MEHLKTELLKNGIVKKRNRQKAESSNQIILLLVGFIMVYNYFYRNITKFGYSFSRDKILEKNKN